MNIFQQETVEIVQWLENTGHEKPAIDLYVQAMRSKLQWFLDRVTSFYRVKNVAVECNMQPGKNGMVGLDFAWFASRETMLVLQSEEPFLYAAFNTPSDMCMCQCVPGVTHNHEENNQREAKPAHPASGSAG